MNTGATSTDESLANPASNLPATFSYDHDRMDYAVNCRQMRALGGDCYDLCCQPKGRLIMLVGGTSGKGVAAALTITTCRECCFELYNSCESVRSGVCRREESVIV